MKLGQTATCTRLNGDQFKVKCIEMEEMEGDILYGLQIIDPEDEQKKYSYIHESEIDSSFIIDG